MTPEELQGRRKALGLSQTELATALGAITQVSVSQAAVSAWELGNRKPQDPISIEMAFQRLEDLQEELTEDLIELWEGASAKHNSPTVSGQYFISDAAFWKSYPALDGIAPATFYQAAAIRAQRELRLDQEIRVSFRTV